MRDPIWITKGALRGLTIAFVLIVVALGLTIKTTFDVSHQQGRQDIVIKDLCRNQRTVRDLLLALSQTQPNLDPRFIRAIEDSLKEIPLNCP